MDWTIEIRKGKELFAKYKYVIAVILVGICMMMLPGTKEAEQKQPIAQAPVETKDTQSDLEQILSQIQGVGRVSVMLMEEEGMRTIYQTDEDISSDGSLRQETVIISDNNRNQIGLVKTVIGVTYRGAVVVCQGADHASVRLAVIEAVSNVTGLSSNRIAVLKMK